MGLFKMKRGMVFVMLTLFGSCVYVGTFFYLSLIEDSEGILYFLFFFLSICLAFRSGVRAEEDICLNDSIKPPPFNKSSPLGTYGPFKERSKKTPLLNHCEDIQ